MLVSLGATTTIVGTNAAKSEKVAKEIGAAHFIAADLSSAAEAERAAREAGPVHLLVNNAGVAKLDDFVNTAVADFDRQVKINKRNDQKKKKKKEEEEEEGEMTRSPRRKKEENTGKDRFKQ